MSDVARAGGRLRTQEQWMLDLELSEVVLDVSALVLHNRYQTSSGSTYYLTPINDHNPAVPPGGVLFDRCPSTPGVYTYIILTDKETSHLIVTRVHSSVEYCTKHVHLCLAGKARYGKKATVRMAGEMTVYETGTIQFNAFSGTFMLPWIDLSPAQAEPYKNSARLLIKQLCPGITIRFVNKSFQMPALTLSRARFLVNNTTGFRAYDSQAASEKATNHFNRIRLSEKVMVSNIRNMDVLQSKRPTTKMGTIRLQARIKRVSRAIKLAKKKMSSANKALDDIDIHVIKTVEDLIKLK